VGTPLKLKARAHRSLRTLFGTLKLCSPRLEHCDCHAAQNVVMPTAVGLAHGVGFPWKPLSMEAKWSSLVSYGMSRAALQDFLPLDRTLDVQNRAV